MTDRFKTDVVVIGAGVVGLAVAAEVARSGVDVVVLEAAGQIGSGTSSRNSEVIHSGIYYTTGSLRHLACVEGRKRLYAYLEARGVAYRRCGKLVVATTPAEEAQIEAIHQRGLENGVEGLEHLGRLRALELEPALKCVAALWCPETGILDSHGFMLALQGDLEDSGGVVALRSPVYKIELMKAGFAVWACADQPTVIECTQLVNCAGLGAWAVAKCIEGLAPEHIPEMFLAKGSYFSCLAPPAFSRLIYPAPVDGGLGVHVTLDLSGRIRFGPDVEWLNIGDPARIDYAVDPGRSESFYAAVRTFWPGLPDGAITPDYSGCRPKLSGLGQPAADFRIDGQERHGIPGLVQMFGIESPGLTSSLALAVRVRALLTSA